MLAIRVSGFHETLGIKSKLLVTWLGHTKSMGWLNTIRTKGKWAAICSYQPSKSIITIINYNGQ